MRARVLYLVAFMASLLMAASAVSAQTTGRQAMLLEAARTNDIAQLRAAIDGGADLEARDGQGRTALLLATHAGAVDLAGLLIKAGADVNAKDEIRDTPFLYAGAEGRDTILKLILATGKANLGDTNRYGGTALIPAAHHGHPSTVCILLASDIDIDHVNDLGWTALLEAVILGDGGPVHQEIVGLLVDAGAKDIADRQGKTALDHARAMGFAEMAGRIETGRRN
ncbi:ankyrin repeat domain-containing protein [Mesorhizobium sp. A556]